VCGLFAFFVVRAPGELILYRPSSGAFVSYAREFGILRSMSMAHSAPKFTAVINRNGVPHGGILPTAAACVLGVGLNYLVPSDAFEIVLNLASIGILATSGIIVVSHLLFVRTTQRGELSLPPAGCRSRPAPRSRRSCSWCRSWS
jgi:L-asparagine transporter-like permease